MWLICVLKTSPCHWEAKMKVLSFSMRVQNFVSEIKVKQELCLHANLNEMGRAISILRWVKLNVIVVLVLMNDRKWNKYYFWPKGL